MQVRSFVLADAVAIMPDGKAMILGAGVGQVRAHTFPWSQAQLAAYVTVVADSEVPGSTHDFRVEIVGPSGGAVASMGGEFVIPPPANQADIPLINFAPAFMQVLFPEPGRYAIRLLGDELELARLPLDLVQTAQPEHGWAPAEAIVQPPQTDAT